MTYESPYTVWLFVGVVVSTLGALLVVGSVDAWLVGGGAVLLVASFGLVAGFWPAWLFLTVIAAGDIAAALVARPAWWALVLNAILLALLLARPTRRHARRGRLRELARRSEHAEI